MKTRGGELDPGLVQSRGLNFKASSRFSENASKFRTSIYYKYSTMQQQQRQVDLIGGQMESDWQVVFDTENLEIFA